MAEHLGLASQMLFPLLRVNQTIRDSTWRTISAALRKNDPSLLDAMVRCYIDDMAESLRATTGASGEPPAGAARGRIPGEMLGRLEAIYSRPGTSRIKRLFGLLCDLPDEPGTEDFVRHLIGMIERLYGDSPPRK